MAEGGVESRAEPPGKIIEEVSLASSVKVLLENRNILEKLCLCLDKKMKFVCNWSHLADKLGIPRDVVKKLEFYTDYSPTIRMFNYLQATRPKFTIGQLQRALHNIYQNNVIDIIRKSGLTRTEETVAGTLSNDGRLLDSIALELDSGSCSSYNWRGLGNELGITSDVLKQFELYSTQSPTKLLFRVLKAKRPLLKVDELRKHLSDMKRKDILVIFNEYSIEDSAIVADVFELDSDIFNDVEKLLNQNITGVGNWRNLSFRLGISSEIFDDFEEHPTERRPTEQILKWLAGARERTTIKDVIYALEEIERLDAVEVLRMLLGTNTEIDNYGTMADMGLAAFALEPAIAEIETEETRTQTNPNTRALVQESLSQHTCKEKCCHGYYGDLPCKVDYFTGRNGELDEVLRMLNNNDYKGGVVVAPYGYGKTTFAAEVAAIVIKEGKIVIYVNLRGISSVDDFAFKVIQALGFEPGIEATAEALARLRSLEKDTVLMADNFDEVIHLGRSQVQSLKEKNIESPHFNLVSKGKRTCKEDFLDYFERIKQNCSKVKLFVTSEEKVDFIQFPLWTIQLEPLSDTESGKLLQRLCSFLSTEEAEALGQICDGIPMNLCNIVSTIQSEGYTATKGHLLRYIQRLSSSPPSKLMETFTAQKNILDLSFEKLDKLGQEMMISLLVLSGAFKLKQAEIVTKHVIDSHLLEEQLKELVKRCFLRFDICREQYSISSFTRKYLIALVENDFNKTVYALARESFVNHYTLRLEHLYYQFLSKNSQNAIGEYRDEESNIKQLLSWCADDRAIDDKKGKRVVDVINMAAPMIAKVTGRVEFEGFFTKLADRWHDHRDCKLCADSLVSIGMKVVLACACSPVLCPRALGDAMTYLHVANQVQETSGIREGNGRAQCLSKFGRCKVRHGYVEKGIAMLTEAKDIRCRQAENDKTAISSVLLATCWNDFAAAYSYRTKFNCALDMSLELVLPTYQEHLGDHPYTASVLNSIGNYYEAIGDFENAIKYTEKALNMRITLLGEHQDTARSYYDLGVALKGKKLYEKALDNLQRAAEIQNKVLDTHEETVKSHQEKAIVLRILGRIKEADDAELLAKEIFKKLPKSTAKESKSIRSLSESMDFPF